MASIFRDPTPRMNDVIRRMGGDREMNKRAFGMLVSVISWLVSRLAAALPASRLSLDRN